MPSSIPAIQDHNATEGDNVTLWCRVSGMPPSMVSWMTPNGERHSGKMLEVTSINRSQAGEYKCEASNECGNATKTASIHVQFKLPGTRNLTFFFFRPYFHYCLSSAHYCEDHFYSRLYILMNLYWKSSFSPCSS